MKLQLGEKYWRRDGHLSGTIIPNDSIYFPYKDAATGVTYRENGLSGRMYKESQEDLIGINYPKEKKDDIPQITLTITGEEYAKNQELLKCYVKEIENLKAVIERKNQIMSEIMDMAREELSKQFWL